MHELLKWINILTTLLSLLSMGVIMLTILLILMVNNILVHAGGQLSTIAGFVSSLITLPTAFKIKIYYGSVQIRKFKKYEINNYHRFILIVSLLFQIFAIVVCFVSLMKYKNADKSFTQFVTEYYHSTSLSSKKYVDNVQFNFQCCGRMGYTDWYECGSSSIPFSCCKILILDKCYHDDIEKFGTNTISTVGCGKKLKHFLLSILLTELFLYVFILFLIILLLRNLNISEDEVPTNKKRKWDHFVNSTTNNKKSKTNMPARSSVDTLVVKKK